MGHVHLHVGNLADAETFYYRDLGFDKTVWNYPGALFMSAGGYHRHLATNAWSPGPAPSVNEARLLQWELVLLTGSDVNQLARSIRNTDPGTQHRGPGITAVDSWGTRVRILAQR